MIKENLKKIKDMNNIKTGIKVYRRKFATFPAYCGADKKTNQEKAAFRW